MTVVAIILLPFVLAYQSWTYYVFRKRVSSNDYQQSATPAPAWRRLAPGDPGRPNR